MKCSGYFLNSCCDTLRIKVFTFGKWFLFSLFLCNDYFAKYALQCPTIC